MVDSATPLTCSSGCTAPPLVVDLDGTLVLTDTLVESVLCLLRRNPLLIMALPLWLLHGRAGFKARVAQLLVPEPATLPYRSDLLAYLDQQRRLGRRLVLATAAHASTAAAVAAHLGLFDRVLASDARVNLKGRVKLERIRREIGTDFVYAGDSKADLPIWAAAQGAVLVGVSAAVERRVRRLCPIERVFARQPGPV